MKAAKWRDLSDDEVTQKVRELTEEIFNLRFQLSMGVAKNPSRIGEARRDLARATRSSASAACRRDGGAARRRSRGAAQGEARARAATARPRSRPREVDEDEDSEG